MHTISEAIRQRRSIRKFRSDPVPDEAIYEMLEAARLAPSGSNRQPWRFILVTNVAEKAKLRRICSDQLFIEQAPVVFVCCADLNAYSKAERSKREQEFVDYGIIETLSGRFADPDYRASMLAEPEPELKTFFTTAVANTYIAIEHMVLTATAFGLGTCWVGAVGNDKEIRELFALPDNIVVVVVLPTGYPATVPPPRPRLLMSEILLKPVSLPHK